MIRNEGRGEINLITSHGGINSPLNPNYLVERVFCYIKRYAMIENNLPAPAVITRPLKIVDMHNCNDCLTLPSTPVL
jgi:hypothetical protein